jgi:hypothetical protein
VKSSIALLITLFRAIQLKKKIGMIVIRRYAMAETAIHGNMVR